jgi:hypothetical protein
MTDRRLRMRGPDAARLALGALCLTRPRPVVRVLGARYVVQALGGEWVHRAWVPAVDAGVDLVHAASMLGVAAVSPRHRRAALASAALATGFAVADLASPTRVKGATDERV